MKLGVAEIAAFSSLLMGIVAVVKAYWGKKKMAIDIYNDVIKLQREQMEGLEAKIAQLEKMNEECEENSESLRLELQALQAFVSERHIPIPKFHIFILEDDEMTSFVYKKKFERTSMVEVCNFDNIPAFKAQVVKSRPQIIILDYYINGETIDKLMQELIEIENYDPRLILVSGMGLAQYEKLPYKHLIWQFFKKDQHSVNSTVKTVLKYLQETVIPK